MTNSPVLIAKIAAFRRRDVRLRAAVAAAFILSMAPVAAYAQSSSNQAAALLRASSTQSAIVTFCSDHYEIDGTIALRISQTAREVAAKVLGQAQSDADFKVELARRYAEVKEAGEGKWCAAQRSALLSGEAKIFKD